MTPEKKTAYFQLHLAIFLWGFTAILGKWISLREIPLVWYRILITCVGLAVVPGVLKGFRELGRQNIIRFGLFGFVIALHWIFFYGSIKFANASVSLSGLATASLFASIMEPLIVRKRIRAFEVLLGGMVIAGTYIIFRSLKPEFLTGLIMALISAFLSSLFSILNKKNLHRADPKSITFAELVGGFVCMSLILPVYLYYSPEANVQPTATDWIGLIVLSLLCTAFTMVLALKAMQHVSAFTANLSLTLEPVYGILMAFVLFREDKDLGGNFYLGTAVILASVCLHTVVENPTLLKRFFRQKKNAG